MNKLAIIYYPYFHLTPNSRARFISPITPVLNLPLFEFLLQTCEKNNQIAATAVFLPPREAQQTDANALTQKYAKLRALHAIEDSRPQTCQKKLSALAPADDGVLLLSCYHPFVSHKILDECCRHLENGNNAQVVTPNIETLRKPKSPRNPAHWVKRQGVWALTRADFVQHLSAIDKDVSKSVSTESCPFRFAESGMAFEWVAGESTNIQVNTLDNLLLADKIGQRLLTEN